MHIGIQRFSILGRHLWASDLLHGVVIDAVKENQPETDRQRKQLAGSRTGNLEIFNRDGVNEELKSHGMVETSRKTPETPQFHLVRGG